jgi:hypothetical protein
MQPISLQPAADIISREEFRSRGIRPYKGLQFYVETTYLLKFILPSNSDLKCRDTPGAIRKSRRVIESRPALSRP